MDFAESSLTLICPECYAAPGTECVTVKGRTRKAHAARWRPLYRAYQNGRRDTERGFSEMFRETPAQALAYLKQIK